MKTFTTTIARIIFAIPFLIFGLMHFINNAGIAGYIQGWPIASVLVYLSGAAFILGSIALIFNWYARLAAFLLALEVLIITLSVHVPGLANPDMMQLNFTAILKNTGLIGGALMAAGISRN